MKRLFLILLTLFIGLVFIQGMTDTAALELPKEDRVPETFVQVAYQDVAFSLSPEDRATILTWLSALELDMVEKKSVDQYYGQPTVPPGDTYELTIQREGEADLVLSFVSALDDEDRVVHRYDSDTEDLDVLVLDGSIAFQAYDRIYALVEEKLYPQTVYGLLSAEQKIKVVSRGVAFDLTENDREILMDFLSALLGHQLNPSDDTLDAAIEWDIPTSPIGLDRLLAGEHFDLRFGEILDHYGLILLSETTTLPPVLVFTDLTRAITLRYDIPEEKREVCDSLIVFLASLSEH